VNDVNVSKVGALSPSHGERSKWVKRADHGPNLGAPAENLGRFDIALDESMRYLYLPVWVPEMGGVNDPSVTNGYRFVPPNLHSILPMLSEVYDSPYYQDDDYVYINAIRGYIPQGHHPNRPGWHADGYGSNDHSFVWFDSVPTLWADQNFEGISPDHEESIRQMTAQIDVERVGRLDPFVLWGMSTSCVHATSAALWGSDRSFVKITLSKHRYNLEGNSHNYLIDYDWPMHDREGVRNHPTASETDYVVEQADE